MKRGLLATLLLSFAVFFGYSSVAQADEVIVVHHRPYHRRVYVRPISHHRHYYRVHREVVVRPEVDVVHVR